MGSRKILLDLLDFGADQSKTGGLKKRDSLKRAGVSEQTLEQRFSL